MAPSSEVATHHRPWDRDQASCVPSCSGQGFSPHVPGLNHTSETWVQHGQLSLLPDQASGHKAPKGWCLLAHPPLCPALCNSLPIQPDI